MAANVISGLLALLACGSATALASPRPPEVGTHTPILETQRARVTDLDQWFASRGATDPAGAFGDSGGCVELVVGTAREDALLCDEMQELGCEEAACWVFTRSIVRVVRAGEIVPVLDVRTQVVGFDTGPESPFVEVRLTVAANGMSATVTDSPETRKDNCKGARTDPDKAYLAARRRVCASRGAFRWKHNHFERVR